MSVLETIDFFKSILPQYCIGGDINMLNEMPLRNRFEVEKWFLTVKKLVGDRRYLSMKKKFSLTQIIDLGFKPLEESKFPIFDYENILELPGDSIY